MLCTYKYEHAIAHLSPPSKHVAYCTGDPVIRRFPSGFTIELES